MEAARFWVEIVCDECARSHDGQFVQSRIPIREMSDTALKNEWILLRNGCWVCPKCQKEQMDALEKDLATWIEKSVGGVA